MKRIILAVVKIFCWLSSATLTTAIVGCTQSSTGYLSDDRPLSETPVAEAPVSETPTTGTPGTPLAITPSSKNLAVTGTFTFSATGGVPPYVFSISPGSGTITTSGNYIAPASASIDIIRVTDTATTTAEANITVFDTLTVSPSNPTVNSGDSQSFNAAGGIGPYTYNVTSGGGSFANATYTAPTESITVSDGSVSFTVTDLLGNTANGTINVSYDTAPYPSAPTSLTLVSPASSPGVLANPIIKVGGVRFGYDVSIYTDSLCSNENLKGTASVITGTTVNITSSTLTNGAYIFYAKSLNTATNTTSSCSAASVSYTVTSLSVSISNGAPYTTSTNVTLNLPVASVGMYITNTPGCSSGGAYEGYSATKAWTLANTNSINTVYVKFQDADGNESACFSDSIIHDNIGPDAPTALILGSVPQGLKTTPTLAWTAPIDNAGGSGVASYQLQIYNLTAGSINDWTASTAGSAITSNTALLINSETYYMKVRAVDTAGNVGTASVASANWLATFCPSGYILVPALTDYTNIDFCVAKYEMKNNNGAKSEAAGSPWSAIPRGTDATTIGGAWKACKDIGTGYDLISNAQWQTIARNIADQNINWSNGSSANNTTGELNRGRSDVGGALVASTDEVNGNCYGTGQTCSSTTWNSQRRTHVLSNGNIIWDFAGNVDEFVKDNYISAQGVDGYSSTYSTGDSRQINFGNDTFCNNTSATPYCGMGYASISGTAGGIYRGGYAGGGVGSGVFSTYTNYSPSMSHSTIGFRCVYSE